jgi:hypothetical protein
MSKIIHIPNKNPNRGHDDATIRIGQFGHNPIHNVVSLVRVGGYVIANSLEQVDDAPLRTVIKGGQQLLDQHAIQRQQRLALGLTANLQCCDRIGHHHGIAVPEGILQHLDKPVFLHVMGVDLVQLGDTDGGRLAHIGVLVFERGLDCVAEVRGQLLDLDAAHCSDRKGSQQRVALVPRVLAESVDAHEHLVRKGLRVVYDVDVHQLLDLQVGRLHVHQHLHEK